MLFFTTLLSALALPLEPTDDHIVPMQEATVTPIAPLQQMRAAIKPVLKDTDTLEVPSVPEPEEEESVDEEPQQDMADKVLEYVDNFLEGKSYEMIGNTIHRLVKSFRAFTAFTKQMKSDIQSAFSDDPDKANPVDTLKQSIQPMMHKMNIQVKPLIKKVLIVTDKRLSDRPILHSLFKGVAKRVLGL